MAILLPMLFLKGLELTLAGSVIATLLLLIRRFGYKHLGPRIMCWLWGILLLKLLLPVSWPGIISLENWTDPYVYDDQYGAGKILIEAGKAWSGVREQLIPPEDEGAAYSPMRMYQDGEESHVLMPAAKQEFLQALRIQTGMLQTQTAMALFWFAGGAGVWCWWRWKSRGMRRWIRTAMPFDSAELDRLLKDCCREAGIRGRIRLMRSALPYPALYGWLRPVILLPYESRTLYREEELRLILLHELWHYKQRDIMGISLARFLRLVHWFNPLIRLALKRYEEDMEMRCDWRVLRHLDREEGLNYGLLLVRQGELNRRALLHGPGLPLLAGESRLGQRVGHVAAFLKRPDTNRRPWRTLMGLGITFLLAFVLLPASNLYDLLRQEQTPILYAYWLEEGTNPRDAHVISSMTAQMSGHPAGDSTVLLFYQLPFEATTVRHAWNRLHLLFETKGRPWPVQIDIRPIRSSMREQGLLSGNVLLMLHYPHRPIKYWGFGTGKKIMADWSSLEQLDSMNVY